jgi:hypothetical protein
MRELRSRFNYANVMSTLAVFLLLGGGGALAARQKTKRIGTNQIKAQAITTGKLKNGAVTGSKIAQGAVDGSKLADGAVTGSKIAANAVGSAQIAPDSVSGSQVLESTLSEVPSANSANPAAFAKVEANGVVDGAASKAITSLNVSHPSTGLYCLSASSFSPRGGQVSAGMTTAQIATILTGGSGPCPQVAVRTFTTGGVAADAAFYVELYR